MTHADNRRTTRMDAVQAPIIAVIGDLIRRDARHDFARPGRGPLRAAAGGDRGRARRAGRSRRRTSIRTAPACRRSSTRLATKLSVENGIETRARRPHHGDRRRQHGVHARRAGDHRAGRRDHPERAVLLQPRDGDSDGRTARAVRVATDERYQLRLDAIRAAITDRDARDRHRLAEQSERRGLQRGRAARGQRALPRSRALPHHRRGVRVLHVRRGAARVAGRRFLAPTAHTIAMYSLSKAYGFAGWRIGYMAYPEHLAPAMAKIQDTILVCPPVASQVAAIAALDVGRALLRAARPRARRRSATSSSRSCRRSRRWRSVPAADGAFYCLLKVQHDAWIR